MSKFSLFGGGPTFIYKFAQIVEISTWEVVPALKLYNLIRPSFNTLTIQIWLPTFLTAEETHKLRTPANMPPSA